MRDIEMAASMSDHETMMWNLETDPWLNPSGAALVMLDQPIDLDHFRAKMRLAVTQLPRLYQRVVPGGGLPGPLSANPRWAPDATFDLDNHIRTVTLEAPGTKRQLLDLAAALYEETLDRERPLWRFVAIDGLESGGGAVWMITHHVISDGIGQMRMAEAYQSLDRDEPAPAEVDLEAVIAAAVAEHAGHTTSSDGAGASVKSAARAVKDSFDAARDLAAEVALWPADPTRAADKATDLFSNAKSLFDQLSGDDEEEDAGSDLWKQRSGERHFEHLSIPLDRLKAAVKANGASINDGFLAGLLAGSARYHATRNQPVSAFNTSFIVSTRKGKTAGGNAFTPVALALSAHDMPMAERLAAISAKVARAKAAVGESGGLSALAGTINMLPVAVTSRAARAKAQDIDIATSNLRGAPVPLYVSGARVLGTAIQGPLAGTPCNATALSTENSFDIGLHIDPVAIADPGDFRQCVADAFAELLALAN